MENFLEKDILWIKTSLDESSKKEIINNLKTWIKKYNRLDNPKIISAKIPSNVYNSKKENIILYLGIFLPEIGFYSEKEIEEKIIEIKDSGYSLICKYQFLYFFRSRLFKTDFEEFIGPILKI